jgi:hypothetical protein
MDTGTTAPTSVQAVQILHPDRSESQKGRAIVRTRLAGIGFVLLLCLAACLIGRPHATASDAIAQSLAGTYRVDGNGFKSELVIRVSGRSASTLAPILNITGSIYGQRIVGQFEAQTGVLNFLRIQDENNRSADQFWRGHLFEGQNGRCFAGTFYSVGDPGGAGPGLEARWFAEPLSNPKPPRPNPDPPPATATVYLSLRIGPWNDRGTQPSTARVVWTLIPQRLSGNAGKTTELQIDRDYKSFPNPVGPKYYMFCDEPLVVLAPGTWKIRAATPTWTTEGVVTLRGGGNRVNFTQGRAGVAQGSSYPGD